MPHRFVPWYPAFQMVEIYNEVVHDLLVDPPPPPHHHPVAAGTAAAPHSTPREPGVGHSGYTLVGAA